jgi:hypothetical protein
VGCYVANIQNVSFATPTNTSGAFSVEAWANGGSQSYNAGIVAKGAWGAEQFTLDTGGASYAYRFTTRPANRSPLISLSSNTNFPDGNWHHLAGVLDQAHSNACFYVDGIAVASAAVLPSYGVYSTSVPVSIGCRLGSDGPYDQQFFGNINDVAIYNYALSANQVATHYLAATAVILTVQWSGSQLLLTWPQGTLLQATSLTGPWTTNSAATSPYLVTPSGSRTFYRVLVQ